MKISDLKQQLSKSNVKGLALDIDETLSFTAKYWVDELSRKFGNPENISAREVLEKYIVVQRCPHFKNDKAQAWMKRARSSNKLQEELPIIENANHMVNKINKIVPIVCYLTIRPDSTVEGTKNWLNKYNFPKAPVVTRPRNIRYSKGSLWKAGVLNYLYPQVLGIVDDNPRLIEKMPQGYKGTVFLYDYHKSHIKRDNFIYCKDWNEVLKNVKKTFT